MPSIGFWLWTLALIAIAIVALILVYPIVNKPAQQTQAAPFAFVDASLDGGPHP